MRVNRIYFRGLKTFQRGFAIFAILSSLAGCVNLGGIETSLIPIADTPQIVDFEIIGTCPSSTITIEQLIPNQSKKQLLKRQMPDIQGNTGIVRFRLNLGEHPDHDQRFSDELLVHLDRSEHHQQVKLSVQSPSIPSNHTTPDWAKGLVWYQVFPERFRDGNPNNNPNSWDLAPISWDFPFGETQIEEVERAWNRRLVDPRKFPYQQNRAGGSAANLVYARRYGGDLIGLYNQLDSLKAQGFTGIYLCPIFQSRSLHKYDADDHRHIDPTLGHPGLYTDPGPGHTKLGPYEDPADESTWSWTVSDRWFVDVFLPKAKSLGLRVVLDGVWNHVGTDHFAFTDVLEHGSQSPFADWFEMEFDAKGKLIAWQGWGGKANGNLPEFMQTKSGDLVAGPKAYVMAVTRRWMDPNGDGDPSDGIDGWRLDVAGEIGKEFWKDWRAQVHAINPDALIIAEIWSDADKMLNDQAFDGQMNYPFAYAVADWLSIGNTKGNAVVCADRLNAVFHHAPAHDLVQFNLISSHDTERLGSMMHNDFQRGYDNESSRWARGSRYDPETITLDDMDRALSAIAVMVASPGSVMIYNGDEYALPGADDPDNRRPIPWDQLGEGSDSQSDARIRFNQAVSDLIRLRNEPGIGEVLRYGDAEFIGIAQGAHAGSLLIRRRLNDRVVEFLIPNGQGEAGAGAPWPVEIGMPHDLGERSRKYGIQREIRKIKVRYTSGLSE